MTGRARWAAAALAVLTAVAAPPRDARGHAGPPFPIVSNKVEGPYRISVWTDPDATDDDVPGGQFWVIVEPAGGGTLPSDTRASVSIRPTDRAGDARSGSAAPIGENPSRRFVALRMDHEGPYAVQVAIAGSLGSARVNAEVLATYDLRPPPFTVALYVVPFLLVGGLWLKLLRHRRRPRPSRMS